MTEGLLGTALPALDDAEGASLPAGLPPVIDAHVHVFPETIFGPLRAWFDRHGWPIRYRLSSPDIVSFLCERGVARVVALQYAHRPGMARALNRYMVDLCAERPEVIGLATVMPGEPDAGDILREAFALGLSGVKLHCHVQCFAPDAETMRPVYEACVAHGKPLIMHASREPKSPAYACDPHALCAAGRIERVLETYPDLRLCVPHLGTDEYVPYAALLRRFDNLWLDTAMAIAGYLEPEPPWHVIETRPDRILYGSDFPNIPYAWDRELGKLLERGYDRGTLEAILSGNARQFFGL